jgi:hypothetical protein
MITLPSEPFPLPGRCVVVMLCGKGSAGPIPPAPAARPVTVCAFANNALANQTCPPTAAACPDARM